MNTQAGYVHRYTSVLRVWEPSAGNAKHTDELLRLLEKYKDAYSDVIFFTQNNHSVRSLERHRRTAASIEPLLRRVEALGLRSGIDVLCSIGFFRDAPDRFMEESYPHQRSINGRRLDGRLCPEHPEVREYVSEQYRLYAALHPQIIYIDDDISSMSCFCSRCVKRFTEQYDLLPEGSSLEKLTELLESEDLALRKRARDAWTDYNARRINELFALIEKAVHSVDPTIRLGFMSHVAGTDGLEDERWAQTLRGECQTCVSWRPGGGVYTEFTPVETLDKAHRIAAQIRYLPPFADRIESEIENYPYHSLRKSPGFTAFEALLYLAAGCTGTAFNVCSTEAFQPLEYERYLRMAEDVRPASERIVQVMGREKARGICFPWSRRSGSDPLQSPWALGSNCNLPLPTGLAEIGLPVASHADAASVLLLDGSTAMQLTVPELKEILSAGVLMDAQALDICNSRGLAGYTGFRTCEGFPEETLGRDLDHPLNLPGNYIRDLRQAFGYCGTIHTFVKTAPGAEYLTEALDFEHNVRGISGGVYENSLGGRIAVDGIQPFSWAYAFPRSTQMKRLLRWLSRDTLGAYILSYHRVALWQRGSGIFLANFAMERAEQLELAVCGGGDRLCCELYEGGRLTGREIVHIDRHDGAYAVYRLPSLPITGELLLYPEACEDTL